MMGRPLNLVASQIPINTPVDFGGEARSLGVGRHALQNMVVAKTEDIAWAD